MHALSLGWLVCLVLNGEPPAVSIEGALVRVIEQVEVPARGEGVIEKLPIREGQLVNEGDVLATLDQRLATLAVEKAQLEIELAKEKLSNDVPQRLAQKTLVFSQADLARAEQSRKRVRESVSDSELENLQLKVDKSALDLDQAKFDHKQAAITRSIKENEFETASLHLKQRTIAAPLNGIVVQIHRHKGEWVQPGEKVVRLLRIDRLRIEGFAKLVDLNTIVPGAVTEFRVTTSDGQVERFPGKIVFVHPEIDAVTMQVRVWAEVDNVELRLRPGVRGQLTILGSKKNEPEPADRSDKKESGKPTAAEKAPSESKSE